MSYQVLVCPQCEDEANVLRNRAELLLRSILADMPLVVQGLLKMGAVQRARRSTDDELAMELSALLRRARKDACQRQDTKTLSKGSTKLLAEHASGPESSCSTLDQGSRSETPSLETPTDSSQPGADDVNGTT
jgi:hypothetical protein